MRLEAQLYAFPRRTPPGRRGPKPLKGERCIALAHRVAAAYRWGKDVDIPWYGGATRSVRVLSDACLWYIPCERPVAIRWVLVIDPTDHYAPMAVFSTDPDLPVDQIMARFVWRWNVAVTFEESRWHLGIETQRQWSDQAIARTTPALFALFSWVCLIAHHRVAIGDAVPLRVTAWYRKSEATFSDVLAMVCRLLWSEKYFMHSTDQSQPRGFSSDDWEVLLNQLAESPEMAKVELN